MRVQDVMTTSVQTIPPTAAAEEAWELMRLKRIHHLVVRQDFRVVGVISDRDVGGREGKAVRKNRTVGELMTTRVISVQPSTPIRKVANLMRGRSIGCVVVSDQGRVVGIVTVSDLLELLGRGVERPVAVVTRWTLKHRTPHRKRHRAAGAW